MNKITLYKRAANGAIRTWSIEVYPENGYSTIKRTSGVLGGAIIEKHNHIFEGKNLGRSNETTHAEQAKSEAASLLLGQHDMGYKTLKALGLDEPATYSALNQVLPEFNTDANGNIKPMLAKTVNWNKVTYPCLVQPKFDGIRCLMFIVDNEAMFLSRKGKDYTPVLTHIADEISNLRYHETDPMPDMILDGEIYAHDLSFQQILSAVKKKGPNTPKLKFRLYDIVNDKPAKQRWDDVLMFDADYATDLIEISPFRIMWDRQSIKTWHDILVADKYEGAMIRLENGRYKQGARSSELLKVKEFDDGEFEIIGGNIDEVPMDIEDDVYTQYTDSEIDSFTIRLKTSIGTPFNAVPMGSRAQRMAYMNNMSELIGKMATTKFFGWTDDKKPRHANVKTIRDYE